MEPLPHDVPARIDALDNRVRHLEVITGEIRGKVDNMATKADIAVLMSEIAKLEAKVSDRLEQHLRLVLVTLAGSLITGVTIMTFVLKYATPPRTPGNPGQPIIITIPAGSTVGSPPGNSYEQRPHD